MTEAGVIPARTLNNLLTKLETLAKEKGWEAVISEYGKRESAEKLAKECGMNFKQLKIAIGTADKLRELLSIPEEIDISKWSLWQ